MATTQTARVGFPFQTKGVARLLAGVIVGAIATLLVMTLIAPATIPTPARMVDGYTLAKVLQLEDAGLATFEAGVGVGAAFDYTQQKLEQVEGDPQPVAADRAPRNLIE